LPRLALRPADVSDSRYLLSISAISIAPTFGMLPENYYYYYYLMGHEVA
jgi:hypothetical protein